MEGEEVRVGRISSCLEERDDEVRVAVEVEGVWPPFGVVGGCELDCEHRRHILALVGGGEGGGGGFVGDFFEVAVDDCS